MVYDEIIKIFELWDVKSLIFMVQVDEDILIILIYLFDEECFQFRVLVILEELLFF